MNVARLLLAFALLLGILSLFNSGDGPHALTSSAQAQDEDAAPAPLWMRQFGSTGFDHVKAMAADSSGVYAAGFAGEALPGQLGSGCCGDAFVRRYDLNGSEIWTRQFGTLETDGANAAAVSEAGVYVAGVTDGTLPGQVRAGDGTPEGEVPDRDAFLRKYDHAGNEIWTRQFGTAETDEANSVSVNQTGVYVAGNTGDHAFIRKYDHDGDDAWVREIAAVGFVIAHGIAAGPEGVYVAGETTGALPGQTKIGPFASDAFVRKYDDAGNEVWTRQFAGTLAGQANAIAVDGSGVYVAGRVSGALPGQTASQSFDAFVRKYDFSGSELWTRQFGSSVEDATGVSVDGPAVYVAGYTFGSLPGQASAGSIDAFVRMYDLDGKEIWTYQFGTSANDLALAVASGSGRVYAGGQTEAVLAGQTSAGGYDAFVVAFGTAGLAVEIEVDIRPGEEPNSINPGNRGLIPVAILSKDGLDDASVVLNAVRFGKTGTEAASLRSTLEDVNSDGRDDLVLFFRAVDTGIECGDTAAVLRGMTTDGRLFQGAGTIRTVGCR